MRSFLPIYLDTKVSLQSGKFVGGDRRMGKMQKWPPSLFSTRPLVHLPLSCRILPGRIYIHVRAHNLKLGTQTETLPTNTTSCSLESTLVYPRKTTIP